MRSRPAIGRRKRWLAAAIALAVAAAAAASSHLAAAEPRVPDQIETVSPPVDPAATLVPPRPSNAAASKAYSALDANCAQCHQSGRLRIPLPAGHIANILDLDAVAHDPALVQPGFPEASPLYEVMLRRHWPVSVSGIFPGLGPPTLDDVQNLRDWIEQVAPQPPAEPGSACEGRTALSAAEIGDLLEEALDREDAASRRDLRFISLIDAYHACASDRELADHRRAITEMLNGLSWSTKPFRLRAFGPSDTLLSVRLSDLGWVAAHWERLAAVYPYAELPGNRMPTSVTEATATQMPLVRADWLAASAMRAPLYYELTGMPETLADLERLLNVSSRDLAQRGAAMRAGITASKITSGHRMIERLPAKHGGMWRVYDFAPANPTGNLLTHPVGPEVVRGGPEPFVPDTVRVIFAGPNGFPKFAVFSGEGKRLARIPDGIKRTGLAISGASSIAGGCIACHGNGPVHVRDELRAAVVVEQASKELTTAMVSLHPDQESFDAILAGDRQRFAEVRRSILDLPGSEAGTLPDETAATEFGHGVFSLASRHQRSATLVQAAREFGVAVDTFRRLIESLPAEEQILARRLEHGPLPRIDLDRVLLRMAGVADPRRPAAPAASDTRSPTIALWTGQQTFKVGDTVTFKVATTRECHLTLIGIDHRGIATVLFPNDFEQANALPAERPISIPSEAAPYRFRLTRPGRETVLAFCLPGQRPLAGIEHTFELQRFTTLGNWKVFTAESLALSDAPPARSEPAVSTRGRNRNREKPAEPAERPPGFPDPHARAAITYEVR